MTTKTPNEDVGFASAGICVELHTFDKNTVLDLSDAAKAEGLNTQLSSWLLASDNSVQGIDDGWLKDVVRGNNLGDLTEKTGGQVSEPKIPDASAWQGGGIPLDVTCWVKSLSWSQSTTPPYDTISVELALPVADAGWLAKHLMSDAQGGCVVVRRRGGYSTNTTTDWPAVAWGFIDNVEHGASAGQNGEIRSYGVQIKTISWFQYLRYTRPIVDVFQAAQAKAAGSEIGGFRIGTLFSLSSWYKGVVTPMLKGMTGVRVHRLVRSLLKVLGSPQIPKSLTPGANSSRDREIGRSVYVYQSMGADMVYNHAYTPTGDVGKQELEKWAAGGVNAIHPTANVSVPAPPPGARVVCPPGIAMLNLGDWKQTSSVHDMIRQNFAPDDALIEMFPSLVPLDHHLKENANFGKDCKYWKGDKSLTPLGRGLNAFPTLIYRFIPDAGETYSGEMAHVLIGGSTREGSKFSENRIKVNQVMSYRIRYEESSRMNVFAAIFPLSPESEIKFKGGLPIYLSSSMKRFGCRAYEPNYTFIGLPKQKREDNHYITGMNDAEIKAVAEYMVKHGKVDQFGNVTSMMDSTTTDQIARLTGQFGTSQDKVMEKMTAFSKYAQAAFEVKERVESGQSDGMAAADNMEGALLQARGYADQVQQALIFTLLRQVNEYSAKVHYWGPLVGNCSASTAYTPELQAGMHVELTPFPDQLHTKKRYGAAVDQAYSSLDPATGKPQAKGFDDFTIDGYCTEVTHSISVGESGAVSRRTDMSLARARTFHGFPGPGSSLDMDFRSFRGMSDEQARKVADELPSATGSDWSSDSGDR